MDFNPEDFEKKEAKVLALKTNVGFELYFQQIEGSDEVRLYQVLFEEHIYILSLDRHELGDLIYKLEDFL